MPITDFKKKEYVQSKLCSNEKTTKVSKKKETKTEPSEISEPSKTVDLSKPDLSAFKNIFTQFQANKMRHFFIEKKSYEFNNKKYYYLSNENLSRDFGYTLGKNENDRPFEVRLCVFNINGKSKEPFLQFFLEITENQDKNVLEFPGFLLQTSSFDNKEEEPSEIFENECFKKFKYLTEDVSDDIINGAYRGYIEHNSIIYAFFDSTFFNLKQNDKQLWCILDEFINEKKVYGNNFTDENIPKMFHDNEFIAYITDENGDRINIPCCLYLCKLNEDESDYINVYVDDAEKGIDNHRILHYVFGNNCLFFTTDPIEKEDLRRLRMIKRYATFIDKSLYVLNISKDIEYINFDEEEDDDVSFDGVPPEDIPKSHYKYSCIYFFENYKQLWCIKDFRRFTEITTNYVFPPFEKVQTIETADSIVSTETSEEP
jgi:hypothetical protein